MSCGDASRIVQCNLRIFDSFRLLSIKYGCGFPRHMLLVRPRYEAVIAGERVMSVLDEFNSSELIKTRMRNSFSSENLSFFKVTPCLNTGE